MDLISIAKELLEAGSAAPLELWDRFAEAVDQVDREITGQAAQEENRMRGEVLDSVGIEGWNAEAEYQASIRPARCERVTEILQ